MSASQGGRVLVEGREIPLEPGMSVLEGLERAGIDAASGCRAGTCCKCMLQATDPPPEAQKSLRPTLRAQGYFLACQARPEGLLELRSQASASPRGVTVEGIRVVGPDVAQIFLRPSEPIDYAPGQYLAVCHPSGEERSYSLASLSASGLLELHVRRIEGGLVSSWLHALEPGAEFKVRGPFGQCFYVPDDVAKKHLLVGTGTGLAPLIGIARDALAQGHRGEIILVHGGLQPDGLYLREELSELAAEHSQLQVHHCVLRDASDSEHQGPLDEVALRLAGPVGEARSFLCGDAGLVRGLQRSFFLAGVPSAEILADAFESPVAS